MLASDHHEVLPWDGLRRDRAELNQDHDLHTAMLHSVVWFYRELARRIGMQRELEFVDTIGYGNRDLSDGLTTFWLGSSLTISADEQVQFLDRLRRGELPLPPRSLLCQRTLPYGSGSVSPNHSRRRGRNSSSRLALAFGAPRSCIA